MKVGVLGLGSIGSRHVRNLRAMGHDVIVYDPVIASTVARSMSREEVIADAEALVIATPTAQHYQDLLDCMAAGKPTFVEKPIAATREQWLGLQNYQSTREVFVGYNLRFHACVIQAKAWLYEGLIGNLLWGLFACAQYNDRPDYKHDLILNWSHEIDLARYLLGPATVVRCTTRTAEGDDDIADMVLVHESGARSAIHLDYVTRPRARFFKIFGSRGFMEIDLETRDAKLYDADGVSASARYFDSWDDDYVDEMRGFISGTPPFGATGDDGLAVLKLCLDAQALR